MNEMRNALHIHDLPCIERSRGRAYLTETRRLHYGCAEPVAFRYAGIAERGFFRPCADEISTYNQGGGHIAAVKRSVSESTRVKKRVLKCAVMQRGSPERHLVQPAPLEIYAVQSESVELAPGKHDGAQVGIIEIHIGFGDPVVFKPVIQRDYRERTLLSLIKLRPAKFNAANE